MEQEQEQSPTTPSQPPAPPKPKHPLELMTDAQNKRRLTTEERRSVLAYISEYGFKENGKYRDLSNYELADLFQVTEAAIRKDKKKILREHSGELTPEDSMQFVQGFLFEHNALIRKAKEGLNKSPEGSLTHIRYLQVLSDLESRKIKLLQESGLLPKELGHLSVTEEEWHAYVLEDGVTGVTKAPPKALPAADESDEFVEAEILEQTDA